MHGADQETGGQPREGGAGPILVSHGAQLRPNQPACILSEARLAKMGRNS